MYADLHNTAADVLEAVAVLDFVDPMVAILERVACPFGCKLLAVALDNEHPPAYYEKLLKRAGVDVLGIELFEGSNIGDFICNGYACMTVRKKHLRRAVRVLEKSGAFFIH